MDEQNKTEYRGYNYFCNESAGENKWLVEMNPGYFHLKTADDCKVKIDQLITLRANAEKKYSESLALLQDHIKSVTEYDKLSINNGKLAIQSAFKAGEKLESFKQHCKITWEKGVSENLPISVDTADRYIKLYHKSSSSAEIAECTSLRQAY